MIIQHFDVNTPKVKAPRENDWEQLWSGYYWMTKCISQQKRTEWAERDNVTRLSGKMTEPDFQRDCLLSVLADIKREHVNICELGAGWGRISLGLAGVIDYKVLPITPTSYRFLAVEAEPTHFKWVKEHFEAQNINAEVIFGAVSNKNGFSHFRIHPEPDSQYGQELNPVVGRQKIPSIGYIRNILSGKTVKVPTFTVDRLTTILGFDHIDLLQMDVQGAEYKVIQGSSESIKKDMIDYILISVHVREYNEKIKTLLTPKFDLIIDIARNSVGNVDGFPPIQFGDGMQLYKRKNL